VNPDSHTALPIGYSLGEYEIESVLGHGGFGITYLAHDTQLGTRVAIKEFFPQSLASRGDDWVIEPIADDEDRTRFTFDWGRQQFLKEAQALGKFKHNNIVRVLRFLEANGTAYMIMEYEVGQSLARMLKMRGGKLDEPSLLRIFIPILNGLQAVHEAGLLHRDIKPDNIYLRADHSPILIDFGAVGQATQPGAANQPVTLTPAYAAVEQYPGQGDEGPWTDIYSVGASMYRCITGVQPAGGFQRYDAIRNYQPDPLMPLIELMPAGFPDFVLQCVDWAMQIYPRNRPQSARDMQDGLMAKRKAPGAIATPAPPPATEPAPLAAGSKVTPSAPKEPVDRFRLVIAGMGLLLIIAATAIWLDYRAKPQHLDTAPSAAASKTEIARPVSVKPAVSATEPVRLVRHFNDSFEPLDAVAFSPATDQVVAAAHGGDLIVWDIASGKPQGLLSRHRHNVNALMSLGGARIAAGDDGGNILVWDMTRKEPVQRLNGHRDAVVALAITPDQRWLASAGRDQQVILWSLNGGKNRVLSNRLGQVSALAISPNGRIVAAGTRLGDIYLVDLETGRVRQTLQSDIGGIQTLCFAPNGAKLAAGGLSPEITVWRTSDGKLSRKLQNPGGRAVYSLAFSPAGNLFVGDGSGLITLWDTAHGELKDRFQRHHGIVRDLVFSPDGKTLASASSDKTLGLWAVR
jgi:serine/threonine protein kinase/Tol biopolymer transport system component